MNNINAMQGQTSQQNHININSRVCQLQNCFWFDNVLELAMTKIDTKVKGILSSNNLITVEQYANKNNLSIWYVRKLCRDKKLKSYKIGQVWVIENK